MIKRLIKNFFIKSSELKFVSGITKKLRTGVIALCYHGVENDIFDQRIQELHLPFAAFEKQIEFLGRNYEFISTDYLYDCIKYSYKINPKQILLTFDDGFKNISSLVAPYLNSLKKPFAVFISTRHISEGLRYPTYYLRTSIHFTEKKRIDINCIKKKLNLRTDEERTHAIYTIRKILKTSSQSVVNLVVDELMDLIPDYRWKELDCMFSSEEPMNWKDLKKLHKLGITVGSHCHDHFILNSNQNISELDYQLKTSKDLIEENIGECRYIAYPDGKIDYKNPNFLGKVKENGYQLGFSLIDGEIDSSAYPYYLPRLGPSQELDHLKFRINKIQFTKHFHKKNISKILSSFE